jgi:lipoprotein-anchoring transpeptidase ErfK/SrfK
MTGPGEPRDPGDPRRPRPPDRGSLEGPPPSRGSLEGPPPPIEPRERPARRRAARAEPDDEPTTTTATTGPATAANGRSGRRNRSRRRRRRLIGAAALVALAGGGFGAWAVLSGDDGTVKAAPASTTTSTTTTTVPAGPPPAKVVTTKVPTLNAYETPDEGAKVVKDFSDKTEYGLARTLLVVGEQPGWFQTLLPMRPNGSIGWVRESDVTVTTTPFHMKVELGAKKITLYNGADVVLESGVAIGRDNTPTPLGTYYVTDPVDLKSRPNGAYGAYALGISGYSEVLMTFNGGPGQIAVHGTANAGDAGQAVSNGCVRVPNEAILKIVDAIAPGGTLGTPVEIVA